MDLKENVQKVIEKVKPVLQRDGGDIEFVGIEEPGNVVLVRLHGACFGCPMSTFTIKGVVEQTLKKEIPAISEVRLVQ